MGEPLTTFLKSLMHGLEAKEKNFFSRKISISDAADVMPVSRRSYTIINGPLEEHPSLAEIIWGLIKEQARMIENLPTTLLDDFCYYGVRPFEVVEAICEPFRQLLPPEHKCSYSN